MSKQFTNVWTAWPGAPTIVVVQPVGGWVKEPNKNTVEETEFIPNNWYSPLNAKSPTLHEIVELAVALPLGLAGTVSTGPGSE